MICPESGKYCDTPEQCGAIIDRADNGNNETHELLCGHDWTAARIPCDSCGESKALSEMLFRECRDCRTPEPEEEEEEEEETCEL